MTDQFELPFQSHSTTSRAAASTVRKARANAQEKLVYECLRYINLADWELWQIFQGNPAFDQISSMRRARIGLVWVKRKTGPTPYHPVHNTGRMNIDPSSGVETTVWGFKDFYKTIPYEDWVERYKKLSRESR